MTAPGPRGVFQNCFMSEHVFTWCHDGLSIMWFLKQSFQTMTCFTICATMIFYIRWFWPQAERRKSKFCKGSLEAAACKGPGLGSLVSLDCIALSIIAGAKKWMGSEPASEPESSVSSESLISRHLFATSNRVAAIQQEFSGLQATLAQCQGDLHFCQDRVQNLEVQLRSWERDQAELTARVGSLQESYALLLQRVHRAEEHIRSSASARDQLALLYAARFEHQQLSIARLARRLQDVERATQ